MPTTTTTRRRTRRLSAEDSRQFREFKQRRKVLEIRVEAVAKRSQNGLVVHGPPGVGKTETVCKKLDRLRCDYEHRSGCGTARGLFELIETFPDTVIVLDDLHSLFSDKSAMQILLAALGGKVGQPRQVTYTKHGSDPSGDCVSFTGGIIAISNSPVPATSIGEALVSRVYCVDFNPTPAEMAAALRDYANKGYENASGSLTAGECTEVANFLVEQAASVDARIDFRVLLRAYSDYQHCNGKRGLQWQTLVTDHLRSMPKQQAKAETKKDRLELDRQTLLKLRQKNPGMSVEELAKLCGMSKSKAYPLLKPVPK